LRLLLGAKARNRRFVDWAIHQQLPNIVQEWLELDDTAELINIRDGSDGSTKLIDAANGGIEIVKLLVEKGADVNMRCWGSDESALDVAIRKSNSEITNYLWPLCSKETRDRSGLKIDPRTR